ncbi:MAG: ABC transporter ATP-binding protein [Anaerolineae bacterium]
MQKTYDLKDAAVPNRLLGLWRMIRGYRLAYTGAIVTLAIGATAKTLTFLLLRYFVDEALLGNQLGDTLLWIALAFVALAVIEGSFTFLSGRLAAQTAEGASRILRNYLFDHLQRMTFTYHDRMKTGELIQRCTSDVNAVNRFFSEQAIGLGRILLLFFVNFVALLSLNVTLALLSVVVVPFICVVSYFFFRKVSQQYERFQEQDAKLSTTLQENLSGVRVVKAFARQDYERAKLDADNFERYLRGRKMLLMHAFYWPLTDIITAIQMLAGYVMAALMAINGDITPGTYIAYVGMLFWIIQPIRNLGRLIVQASTGLVSYERVAEIIREPREPLTTGETLPKLHGEVIFKNVGFHYETDKPILKNINFTCKAGQTIALLGSTGSGKTTLVSLLPRFYEYTDGLITVDGVDIKNLSREFLRSSIGIVEQEPFLFSRTIRENITYGVGRAVSDEEVIAAARAASVHDVILSFPEGYNTLVGERGVTLSGGQKQRVAIARTLLKNPRILILDDSTSSVDTETEASIRDALELLMENRTTFVIAHRIQSVLSADLILVLDKGQIVQRGTHASLLKEPGIYREIYDLQERIENELVEEIASV